MELVEDVRQKICSNIKSFDLCALLKVLHSYGYTHDTIYFLSNSIPVSYTSLCEDIHFNDEARQVTITLNIGLLGANTLIPSFIQRLVDLEDINGEQFLRFLNFFNHQLINTLVRLSMPDLNDGFFMNWKYAKLQYLKLLGFESVSTLWFLMKISFPDLVVEVKKDPQVMRLHTSSLTLGKDVLGPNSYLGTRFKQMLSSFKITFTTESEESELGTPWPVEIKRQLSELIFPLLRGTDLHFSIFLVIKNKCNYLTLSSKSFLGFERMGKSKKAFQLLIFHGMLKDKRL